MKRQTDSKTKSFSSNVGKDFGTGVVFLLLVALGCIVIATLPLILPIIGIIITLAIAAGLIITVITLLGKVCNILTGVGRRKIYK
jgi:hypothetical protein